MFLLVLQDDKWHDSYEDVSEKNESFLVRTECIKGNVFFLKVS